MTSSMGLSNSKGFSFNNKQKLNRADYMFKDQIEKFAKKLPGQVDGKMFKITGCKDSNLYLHDFHDTAQVLNCENCVIILGPNSSSCFIRDCKNCKMVVTVKQLRVRDCHNLQISLYAQTEPVIESSSGITIMPHQYVYDEFFDQMRQAQLSIWNNKYTEVFDFTPSGRG
jgi:protein XRP2